jgi:hypothetical protein
MYETEKKMSILCNLTHNAEQYFKPQKTLGTYKLMGDPKQFYGQFL